MEAGLDALENLVAASVNKAASTPSQFDDLYWDGRNFFMKTTAGYWSVESAAMVTSILKVRGFSDTKPKGGAFSPLDKAKVTICRERKVDGSAPRLYCQKETYNHNGDTYLNTARVKIMPAAPTTGKWGEFFPRYAAVLDNVFDTPLYQATFLAWFKRFYESAEAGELALGQSMALVGPVQCFKSFIIEKLLTPAMGGYADLSDMASGDNNGFNSEIFHSPIAVIDDSKGSSSESMRSRYSAVIKKLAAHGKHKFHQKFQEPTIVDWKGRVVLGLNNDPKSIRLLPDLDQSNEDKMIALHMHQWPGHPSPDVYTSVIQDELHHFLSWLKAWVIPPEVADPMSRYGIKSLISKTVKDHQFQGSASASIMSIIELWWSCLTETERKQPWVGTASQLHRSMGNLLLDTAREVLRGVDTTRLGYRLADLAERDDSGVAKVQRGTKYKGSNKYTIFLPWIDGNNSVTLSEAQDKA